MVGRGPLGQPGPGASENIPLCAESMPRVLMGAPSTWMRGVGQTGTRGAGGGEGGANEMALACHSQGQAGVLKSPGFSLAVGQGFGIQELRSKSWLCHFLAVCLQQVT